MKIKQNTEKNYSQILTNSRTKRVASILRQAMYHSGIETVCCLCGIEEIWNNTHIRLQIDHIDGNNKNNQIENLRFLCPNCHSQTETFTSKNIKITKEPNSQCVFCFKNFYRIPSKLNKGTYTVCSNECRANFTKNNKKEQVVKKRNTKYTKEVLQEAVNNSISIVEIARYFGKGNSGSTQSRFKRMCIDYGIDISHLNKRDFSKSKYHSRQAAKDILVKNEKKRNVKIIRQAMLDCGVVEKCSICDITDSWNSKYIRLQVDHVNGDSSDNRLSNLRFLCPNCHSQTDTFCSKNAKRKSSKLLVMCEICGKELQRIPSWVNRQQHIYCSKRCFDFKQRMKMKDE